MIEFYLSNLHPERFGIYKKPPALHSYTALLPPSLRWSIRKEGLKIHRFQE
jgi:hypothetical protein